MDRLRAYSRLHRRGLPPDSRIFTMLGQPPRMRLMAALEFHGNRVIGPYRVTQAITAEYRL